MDQRAIKIEERYQHGTDSQKPQKLEEIWKGRDCLLDSTIKSSAIGQVRLAFLKFQNNEFEDVAYWEPFYLKDFIAGKKAK